MSLLCPKCSKCLHIIQNKSQNRRCLTRPYVIGTHLGSPYLSDTPTCSPYTRHSGFSIFYQSSHTYSYLRTFAHALLSAWNALLPLIPPQTSFSGRPSLTTHHLEAAATPYQHFLPLPFPAFRTPCMAHPFYVILNTFTLSAPGRQGFGSVSFPAVSLELRIVRGTQEAFCSYHIKRSQNKWEKEVQFRWWNRYGNRQIESLWGQAGRVASLNQVASGGFSEKSSFVRPEGGEEARHSKPWRETIPGGGSCQADGS